MENKDGGIRQEEPKLPSDSELIETYQGIGSVASAAIREGQVIGNPTLEKGYFDPRWSIALEVDLKGTASWPILRDAIERLRKVEPTINFVPADLLHITLAEVAYGEGEEKEGRRVGGRKSTNMRSRDVLARYHAVNNNLPGFPPIHLKLWKIIPTLDPQAPGQEGRTAAIVAAFVTDDDPTLFQVMAAIKPAVEGAGLSVYHRPRRVIFATLGYLTQPPKRDGRNIPLLDALDSINGRLPPTTIKIDQIHMLLSTVNYRIAPWVFIDPPIALRKGDRDPNKHISYKRTPRPSRFAS
ncbi:MAG: hypothetical protein HY377_01060 [Candidatus Blackburnbacteria bacterium]|nr:hypothetical protein [Candidatus Blackburnbacteria bacterium]